MSRQKLSRWERECMTSGVSASKRYARKSRHRSHSRRHDVSFDKNWDHQIHFSLELLACFAAKSLGILILASKSKIGKDLKILNLSFLHAKLQLKKFEIRTHNINACINSSSELRKGIQNSLHFFLKAHVVVHVQL